MARINELLKPTNTHYVCIYLLQVCVLWNGIKVKHNKRYQLCGAYNKGYSYLISEVTAGTDKLLSINEFNFHVSIL
jgi:hypothetical protein